MEYAHHVRSGLIHAGMNGPLVGWGLCPSQVFPVAVHQDQPVHRGQAGTHVGNGQESGGPRHSRAYMTVTIRYPFPIQDVARSHQGLLEFVELWGAEGRCATLG